MPVLDSPEFDRWRAQAAHTAATAQLVADGDSHGWACFLCEQAAQLATKGLLHALGEPAWGHDLPTLVRRAAATVEVSWPEAVIAAEELSRNYIPARYPDAHPAGTPDEHYNSASSEMAFGQLRTVLAAIDGAWQDLRDADDAGPEGRDR